MRRRRNTRDRVADALRHAGALNRQGAVRVGYGKVSVRQDQGWLADEALRSRLLVATPEDCVPRLSAVALAVVAVVIEKLLRVVVERAGLSDGDRSDFACARRGGSEGRHAPARQADGAGKVSVQIAPPLPALRDPTSINEAHRRRGPDEVVMIKMIVRPATDQVELPAAGADQRGRSVAH